MSSGKKKCNDNSKIVDEDIRFIIPRNSCTEVLKDIWYSGQRRWLDPVTYPKSVSLIPGEGSGELSEEKLTGSN